jgi:RNA polymerase sigma factor (sigma-70 family)
MNKDLLITVSVKNNALLTAMRDAGYASAAALSRASGVFAGRIYDYLNLRVTPLHKNGEWRSCIIDIAKVLRRLPDDLFPAGFLDRALATNKVTREVSADELPALMGGATYSIAYDPERSMAVNEALDALNAAVATLRPRDARILRMYYGLDGKEPRTLEEIGQAYRLSKERVRQIVLRAQRRLANPRHQLRQLCAPLLEDVARGEKR